MDFSKCTIPEEFLVVRPPGEKKADDKKRKSENPNSNQKPGDAAKKPKFDKNADKKQKSGEKWAKKQKPKNDDAAKGVKTKANKKNAAGKKPKQQLPVDPQKPRFVPKKEVGSVVYLGHIPDGFRESAMRGFFSQFGKVENVKLARSQDGKSRGYAFIKFQYPEVAQVVAETMNNYLLSDKLLKCRVMTGDSFKFYGDAPKNPEQRKKKALAKHDSSKLPDDVHKRNRKILELFMEKKKQLAALGIDLKEEDVFDVAEKGPGSEGRYFEEASLTSEKEGKVVGDQLSAKKKKLADKRKKAKAKKAAREKEDKEEEEAIAFALENLPGCKKLMGKLAKAAESNVVIEEEMLNEEAEEENSEDDDDSDDGEEEETDDEEDEEMETTGVSLASTYKGHDIRQFGDSDSEIELNTPPGLKKRKVGSKAAKNARNSQVMDSSDEEEDDDEEDVSMDSDDSGDDSEEEGEGEGNDEGFEDTVSEKAVAVTPKQKTPKNSGKSPVVSQKKTAEKPGKKTPQPSSSKKTPQPPPSSKKTPQPPSSPKKTPQKNQPPKTPASASTKKQQKKKQVKDTATPLQFITGGSASKSAKSTGKKAKKLSAEPKREQLRRLEKQRRRSAPAGDALVSKKFKSGAFLDRSFNRGPSRRADEIDED